MGGAIARGLCKSDFAKSLEICCADKSEDILNNIAADYKCIMTTKDNRKAVEGADIIIVAVKPWLVESVFSEIKDSLDYGRQIIVSIAAGVEFEKLLMYLKKSGQTADPALFRIIPNTAIEVRESVNFVSAINASQEQIDLIMRLFGELGLTLLVEERLIRSGTALASCGIAYAFRYIRANIEGAVEIGLYPEQAKKIMIQTLRGAITLLEHNNSHPEVEIDRVTTPGGITIKGLNVMEAAGFTQSVIKGLKASM